MSATTIPGPHPDPHRPTSFVVPPNACDAHCHIFGPGDRFPFAADRAYTPPDSGIDDFQALQERLGLSRAVFVQASCHVKHHIPRLILSVDHGRHSEQ